MQAELLWLSVDARIEQPLMQVGAHSKEECGG
jgi:hypothetical protein